ncbi:hypothetical protein M3202_15230 [Alkalihalobacillus oceani]|uniref:Uncharacterized protein n=1 Tax=Halalkalibacter oceani TaxID=1653776 RepID=A0A9X2DU41_9BACI|nr:hypothetical protein [Halalkalibacter oceani]MCM3715423.1 hypothetical protein [Halalkalibacter oceani]
MPRQYQIIKFKSQRQINEERKEKTQREYEALKNKIKLIRNEKQSNRLA